MKTPIGAASAWVTVLPWLVPEAGARAVSGNLVGNIQNASGATVANATLEAQNEATGVKTTVRAATGGDYRFTNLPGGSYSLHVSAVGLAGLARTGVLVEVSRTAGPVINSVTPGQATFNNTEAICGSNARAVQLTVELLF